MSRPDDDTTALSYGPRTIRLPEELEAALAWALTSAPAARWTREALAVSERYRAPRAGGEQPLVAGRDQALGYVALVMPATYAQLHGAMAATAARIPDWAPSSVLDLGAGPGTALWATADRWPSLCSASAYEREPAFVTLGRAIGSASHAPSVRGARWERQDLTHLREPEERRFDLVVLGHVLNELEPPARRAVVEFAWRSTAGVLLIVEPGTSAAFEVVRSARDRLLDLGARTIAPCPNDLPCPLAGDWCHFPQRVVRPDFQRRARGAPSPWEDAKFSYAAMARFAAPQPIWARIIDEPSSNKAYSEVLASTRDGIARLRGLKRYREAYRHIRGLLWGETLAEPLPSPADILAEPPRRTT